MANPDLLDRILVKTKWAKKYIADLESALDSFYETNPYRIAFKDDPDKRERTYYVFSIQDVPGDIKCRTGDILQNLRSTLDHLAYQLAVTAGNNHPRRTSFPICSSAREYQSPTVRRIKKCFRQDAIKAIDAIKPYRCGNATPST